MFVIRTSVPLFDTIWYSAEKQHLSVKTHNPGNPGSDEFPFNNSKRGDLL